jgi:hypothetical protein
VAGFSASILLCVPVETRALGISPPIPVVRLLRAYRSGCPWRHGHRAYRPPFPWPVTPSISLCVPVEARAPGTPPSTPGVVTSVYVELHVNHLRPCSCPSCVRTSRQEPRNLGHSSRQRPGSPGHSCDDQHVPKICDDLQVRRARPGMGSSENESDILTQLRNLLLGHQPASVQHSQGQSDRPPKLRAPPAKTDAHHCCY